MYRMVIQASVRLASSPKSPACSGSMHQTWGCLHVTRSNDLTNCTCYYDILPSTADRHIPLNSFKLDILTSTAPVYMLLQHVTLSKVTNFLTNLYEIGRDNRAA